MSSSSGLSKFTENLVYRANIFNYDSKYFEEFSKGPQVLDAAQFNDSSFKNVVSDFPKFNNFLSTPIKNQLEHFHTLTQLLNESDGKTVISKEAKLVIQTLIDVINCSVGILKSNESERIANQDKMDVSVANQKKQYSEKLIGNITYSLAFLDGLLMFNIDLSAVYELIALNVGVKFHSLLNTILQLKELPYYTKEIASHVYCASVAFTVQSKFEREDYKEIITWIIYYYETQEKKRDNCFTSNLALLLSNDVGLACFIEDFKSKRIIPELMNILTKEYSINTVYESLMCIWNITNSDKYLTLFENRDEKLVEKLIQVIKTNKVEKIVRIGALIVKVSSIILI